MQYSERYLRWCCVCPRACEVDRIAGQRGWCRLDATPRIAAAQLHMGEERPLVGRRGSGTIFFSSCNLRCVFCQNSDISDGNVGRDISVQELAETMLRLEVAGAENINLVTPTHQAPMILDALKIARYRGLQLPLVYNSGGFDEPNFLAELEGHIDIYMPDMKFNDPDLAERYVGTRSYPEYNRAAVREMHRQVGDLELDQRGVARRGLLVRHLAMPSSADDSRAIIEFVANEISVNTYINIMGQYHPAHHAHSYPELRARPARGAIAQLHDFARKCGLHRLAD